MGTLKKLLKLILAIALFDRTVSVGLTILFRMVNQRNVIHLLRVNTFAVQNGVIVEVPKSIVIARIASIIEIHVQKAQRKMNGKNHLSQIDIQRIWTMTKILRVPKDKNIPSP